MKNLKGYILPQDSLYEIRALLMKRYQSPFSEGLSSEARIAMLQVAEEETRPHSREATISPLPNTTEHTRTEKNTKGRRKSKKQEQSKTRKSSFSHTFEKKSTERLEGDITDENSDKSSQKKRAIGGKLESAMETIEIVKHGEPDEPVDVDAVKRNSVEKCLVWMEVNGEAENEQTVKMGRYNTAI